MTELDEILALLVEQVDGALSAAVAGMDGLIVEQYPPDEPELAAVAAEITVVLNAGRTTMQDRLQGGALRELVLGGDRRIVYAKLLAGDLFCLIVLGPSGNLGKARLYADQAEKRLAQVLA